MTMQLDAAHRPLRILNPFESAIKPEKYDQGLTMTFEHYADPSTDAYSCDLRMWPPTISDSMRQ